MEFVSIKEVCKELSISEATGKNWIKLGKIIPSKYNETSPLFSKSYLKKLKLDIVSGDKKLLRQRRNKKFVSGSMLYKDYVSENSENINNIKTILDIISENNINITNSQLKYLLAECAIQLLVQRNLNIAKTNLLQEFLNNNLDIGEFAPLIQDLIDNKKTAIDFIQKYSNLFSVKYVYEPNEDILGLLYISCKNLGQRKTAGMYYTPTKIVRLLIENLSIDSSKTILDPCCGTGNFLLQLPHNIPIENIFAKDIDEIAICLTRINLALKYKCNTNILYKNISLSDYLSSHNDNYDFIIGNPPWGCAYDEDHKKQLRKKFASAKGNNIESYDLFLENSINQLNKDGVISFVLPEAILSVKSHTPIRNILMQKNSINYINYLDEVFDGVQCPSVILQCKNKIPFSTKGMRIVTKNEEYTIDIERKVSVDCFNFNINDEEYNLLEKINNIPNKVTLKDKSLFALGIVTGNNKEYISQMKNEKNEMVLKGSDIVQYLIKPSKNYITFAPETFQQVAPIEIYRAPEKLFYKFISKKLVFAYDNNQTLSLNSCNILIPQIKGLNIKYILAILNSSVAQFVYSKQFNSTKVLRSHIEQIPIPFVDIAKQDEIIKLVDELLSSKTQIQRETISIIIDEKIKKLYGLK